MVRRIEWPTILMMLACYGAWLLGVGVIADWSLAVSIPVVALAITLHSSLRHEAIHGHPTRHAALNAALVLPALDLLVPYGRFRDTHLAHHHDEILTDPYDDPETNYLDPALWSRLPGPLRGLLRANNTLAGRMILGPAIGMVSFLRSDLVALRAGDGAVARAWAWHIPAVVIVVGALQIWGAMAWWAYGLSVYGGMAVLKVRTYLEHRAHAIAGARTAIVEDRGPLALLFLNNNLHAVHHLHPGVAWYDLPARYDAARARFRAGNDTYVYRSYATVAARHLWRAKDPVAHPFYVKAP